MSGASWIIGHPRERHASAPARTARDSTTSAPTTGRRFNNSWAAALLAELLIEDLADEAVDRDGIEAHIGGRDDPGVDHLALRQLLEHALEVAGRVPLMAPDLELLALERDPRGIAEAEHSRDQALVHQLRLLEHLTVGRAPAAADHEPRRNLDAAANLHRASGLIVLGPDEDVRQHVIARDDPGHRLAHYLRLVEDVPEEL